MGHYGSMHFTETTDRRAWAGIAADGQRRQSANGMRTCPGKQSSIPMLGQVKAVQCAVLSRAAPAVLCHAVPPIPQVDVI